MASFSRLYIRDRGEPGERVWMRCETATPPSPDPDASAGDVCIVKDGASSTILQYDGSAWSAISGSSSSSIGYYSPLAAPASPDARDDEFATLSGWTTWNPGSLAGFAASASASRLKLVTTPQASGTNILAGIVKASPTGADWSAWTKLSVRGNTAGTAIAPYGGGLFLATADIDGNPSTADVITCNFYTRNNATTPLFYVQSWTAYNAPSGTLVGLDLPSNNCDLWVRVRWANSTTRLSVDICNDGEGWKQVYTTTSPFLTPARIGFNVIAGQGASDPSPTVLADFIRFSSSAALADDTLGASI